ncbi:malonyl-[acyl-carrier protein] O-methyltransferase BioC [Vibrio cholerae]|uniref:Malonyl-[acyl-carrier protein] O-methyltransferase n=1 Tax=Vibrio cholerae TaxID=666 RepID=A0A395TGJ8_VIBCL|nr:malonyl-ACP O-methyltransferase BioC [Vibrio cholerae]EGR0771692.1 malonyl-[acyl-carrier protein] O-methyltransferase BioC [Vibrio cholerae]EGR0776300.1 malonyl-[acyl-carrier protein] O-methyltransferase BioC [Vibrio cholerae]EGR0780056.1 malonyl-[acyl-carrier protein] O-methyltransferase BioC [Vibrio cholerae]EGR0821077.1 malonyl-[acyl-carrier protein] O-methyltransferase BioC [Vibrio cholerae]EGR0832806.1 malonyl-[acyl-carrier protein] O-methyltransferase BioC [Vibrio cholerae]
MSMTATELCVELKDKSAIAQAFGKAAAHYDQHAAFQRDVGLRLLQKMPSCLKGLQVLDLGCGTGYFSALLRERGAQVVCADISHAMLEQARQRCGDEGMSYQLADAEQLPFTSACFDLVFSSLALQWCEDLSLPLSEIRRVLKPHGQAFLSTLLDGSLFELEQAWRSVDHHRHINQFISINQVKIALAQAGCAQHHLDLAAITVWYETAFMLMRDLKGIGANHVSGRSTGLISRRTLAKVELAYQSFRNQQGLVPATYQICLGVIHR